MRASNRPTPVSPDSPPFATDAAIAAAFEPSATKPSAAVALTTATKPLAAAAQPTAAGTLAAAAKRTACGDLQRRVLLCPLHPVEHEVRFGVHSRV